MRDHRHAFCRTANRAVLALEKLRQNRPLDAADEHALTILPAEFERLAADADDIDDEVFFARRLSSHRVSAEDDLVAISRALPDQSLPEREKLDQATRDLAVIRHNAPTEVRGDLITGVQTLCLRLLHAMHAVLG